MKKTIIVPDVHGRRFWRDAIKCAQNGCNVVFLGDYLDPYQQDGVTPESAICELVDILELKRSFPDRVTLLLGNHDLGYLDKNINICRRDKENAETIRELFQNNIELFDLVHTERISHDEVLFSHAGIGAQWVKAHRKLVGSEIRPERLNEMLHDEPNRKKLFKALADVSFLRGGNLFFGSPVWADVEEYVFISELIPGYTHVFGHTRQKNGALLVGGKHYCLDCAGGYLFSLDSNGQVDYYMEN